MLTLHRIKSLVFTLGPTLGPILLPRLITWYRTQRAKANAVPQAVQPLPKNVRWAMNILFCSALLAFTSSLPYFAPEDIFMTTSSRLQTPNDVIFTRLALLRGNQNELVGDDAILRSKLASLDARLLYLTYGPDVVTHCPFCNSDQPMSYLYYALPAILLPHLLHAAALGLATSSALSEKYGSRWRNIAASVGIALACFECYLFGAYDWKANARAYRPEEYVHFYWRVRVWRGLVIVIADLLLASCLYLCSTNRFFVIPVTSAERMETAIRALEMSRGKLNALGVMRNVTARDEALRQRTDVYWKRERQIMGEVMDEREVVEGVKNALSGKIKVTQVEEEARKYAEGITTWPQAQLANGSLDTNL